MPKKIDAALRERALRMVEEHRADYPSVMAVSKAAADRLGIGKETVRRWSCRLVALNRRRNDILHAG